MSAPDRKLAALTCVRDAQRALDAAMAELHAAEEAEQSAATAAGEAFTCPRRAEAGIRALAGDDLPDRYTSGRGMVSQVSSCTYCGSMDPAAFMASARDGVKIGPTDKPYKAYVGEPMSGKFYYQHLDEPQRREFVDLHNDGRINWGPPGHPYVLPFFMGRRA
jgi:hypothetical protein